MLNRKFESEASKAAKRGDESTTTTTTTWSTFSLSWKFVAFHRGNSINLRIEHVIVSIT
jgi:hypothetical protein